MNNLKISKEYKRIEIDLAKKIIFEMENIPSLIENNIFVWGFLLYDKNIIDYFNIEDKLNHLKGHFFGVIINNDSITIFNDITAGFRVYVYEDENLLFYSDNYRIILKNILKNHIEFDEYELSFWKEHRFTTGSRTFIRYLNKVPPASIIKINKSKILNTCYFKDYDNDPDRKALLCTIRYDLEETMKLLKDKYNKFILFFSGGYDSALLAVILKSLYIDFDAIFIKTNPIYKENYSDYINALRISNLLKLNLNILEISLDKNNLEMNKLILDDLLFDRHFALLFYYTFKLLSKKYPKDVLLLFGQSADSVFSFGPTGDNLGGIIRRILINYPFCPLNIIFKEVLSKRIKKNFICPRNMEEYFLAFFDEKEYIPLLREDSYKRKIYLTSIINQIKRENALSSLMYLKLFGFLQGSDNQVIYKAANAFGFKNVFLPYAQPSIIYAICKYKSKFIDTFIPKYPVKNLLKYYLPNVKIKKINYKMEKEYPEIKIYEKQVEMLFINYLDKIRSNQNGE